MRLILLIFFYFYVIFLISSCKSSIISKKELKRFNDILENSVYVSISELYLYEYDFKQKDFKKISNVPIIKKNTKLKIQLESQDDWLRIRVFELAGNPKQNFGNVVFYMVSSEEKVTLEDLKKAIDEFINQFFQKVN